jgi:lipoprotein signal peptidase
MVLAALATNARITGVPIVLAGAASNLAAIVANGGYMPAGADAMAALGWSLGDEYSNSTVVARPALELLTDIFALPAWVPFTNVFSIGDVLIGVGVCVVIVAAMRRGRAGASGHIPETGHPA